MKFAEVVVDRPIVRRGRRIVPLPENAGIPLPEQPPDSEAHRYPGQNPLALTFHYHIPPHLADRLQPGHLVAVPFRTQQLAAVVVNLTDDSPVENTRPIADLLDPEPVLRPTQLALARWLSDTYLAPISECIRLFLPPGTGRKPEFFLQPATETGQPSPNLPPAARRLLADLYRRKTIPLSEVDSAAANLLIEHGLARKVGGLAPPKVGPKMEHRVELLVPPDEVEKVLLSLGAASSQADILLHLHALDDPLPALPDVLAAVGCSRSSAMSLAKKGWVRLTPAHRLVGLSPAQQAAAQADPPRSDAARRVLAYLQARPHPVPVDELKEALGVSTGVLNNLHRQGRVTFFDEPERIALTLPEDHLTEAIIQLRRSHKQAAVLRLLAAEQEPLWVGLVYSQTSADRQTLRQLAEAGLVRLHEARRWRDPLLGREFKPDHPPPLTSDQQAVWEALQEHWRLEQPPRPVLLHGVTGSGKTEIYLRAIAAARQAGQGAIMLVPEITLAAQTVMRVGARFPDDVAVWHSALSPGERYDTWERVRRGELSIVVGPRSALFAPVKNLGVIIVDEEHEPVYKQRDRSPIFHARETALELARLSGALVILGSATPDVSTYRLAERGEFRLLHLPNRILAHTGHKQVRRQMARHGEDRPSIAIESNGLLSLPLPPVEVVDMREELKAGNRTIFSRALQEGIRETLDRGEQVILFLNRRGSATFVICRDCGYVMACPRCETTLTYHADNGVLVCHYCGYHTRSASVCPECKSRRIRYFGLGTQRVEEAVREMFPQAQPIRWDQDSTRQKGSHDIFLEHFQRGHANVMVGTQMVAKGLDLPLVTLVGVISADTALYLPDFRAAERTFQLLMQVAGRAGRSPLGGRVIVQTYNPDQPAILAAAQHDYEGFYRMELAFRREQQYPPFKRLALLLYSGPGAKKSAEAARSLARRLRLHVARQGYPAVEVIGPTPGYVRRVQNEYRWQILLRAPDPAEVLRPLLPLPAGWRVDIDPVTLL